MKYTIESYKTGKIKIIDVPKKILMYGIKESLRRLGKYDLGLGCTYTEILFCLIFNEERWTIFKLPLNKRRSIMQYVLPDFEGLGIKLDSLYGKGCSDFLLVNYKKKKFKFVEVKYIEKRLNKNQEEWVKKFGYDVEIVKLAKLQDGYRNYTNKEIIEMNRIIRI